MAPRMPFRERKKDLYFWQIGKPGCSKLVDIDLLTWLKKTGRGVFLMFSHLLLYFVLIQISIGVVLQPWREREGFPERQGGLPANPSPLSPPPYAGCSAGCTLKQRAFLPLFLPPHTAHTISSPRLHFLGYVSIHLSHLASSSIATLTRQSRRHVGALRPGVLPCAKPLPSD